MNAHLNTLRLHAPTSIDVDTVVQVWESHREVKYSRLMQLTSRIDMAASIDVSMFARCLSGNRAPTAVLFPLFSVAYIKHNIKAFDQSAAHYATPQ